MINASRSPAVETRGRAKPGMAISVALLSLLAAVMLLPLLFTFLYSFFPQSEITTYLKLRGNYDDTQWLSVLLSPKVATIRQYYAILIENPQYLKLFVNSVKYTAGILLGQALVIPMMAYALSRFTFKGRGRAVFCDPDAHGAALSGHHGSQRHYASHPGADANAVGGHPADVVFAVLHLPAAAVYDRPA